MSVSIVCGVDGSDESLAAAAVAGRLAERIGARLVLGQVVKPTTTFTYRHQVRTRAYDVEEEAPARLRVELAPPAAALDRSADEEHAELIVVGTHGRGPFASALLGSTSARLAAFASGPVVVIPLGSHFESTKQPT